MPGKRNKTNLIIFSCFFRFFRFFVFFTAQPYQEMNTNELQQNAATAGENKANGKAESKIERERKQNKEKKKKKLFCIVIVTNNISHKNFLIFHSHLFYLVFRLYIVSFGFSRSSLCLSHFFHLPIKCVHFTFYGNTLTFTSGILARVLIYSSLMIIIFYLYFYVCFFISLVLSCVSFPSLYGFNIFLHIFPTIYFSLDALLYNIYYKLYFSIIRTLILSTHFYNKICFCRIYKLYCSIASASKQDFFHNYFRY